ncbi:hypothetical protein MRX96_018032 [Rhipicephalus microplus]
MSFGDLANNNNNRIDGIAHGRAPPLLAPPLHTYSTPELTSQGLSYEVNPAQLFANMHLNYQYKPPPPYPYGQRPSASTPDLTRNHHQLRASASPDLVSRRHLSQSTIQGSEPSLPHYQAAVNGNVTSETLRSIVEPPRPVLPTYVPVGESWNAQVSGVAQPQRIQVCVSTPTTREQVVAAMAKPIDSTPVPPPRKQVTEEKRAPPSQEASPAHPLGPMMVAAMNGLTLTVAQPDQLLTGDQDNVDQESPSPSTSKELRPEQILESRLEDGQVFLEFERIAKRKPNADFTTALLSENTTRNRFSDVLPYEENRVRLTPTPDNRSGYINASHVSASVGDSQRFYIAAQGPTRETAKSFWQMVWENHVGVVVMLTETEDEHGREKCFQYWPTADGDDAALSFGEYRVARKGVVSSAVAVTTSLTLSKSQGVACSHRNVWHLRYTDWPDHGTPGDIQGFLGFMEEVDSVRRLASGDQRLLRTRNTPMVVHCTAGVGRSGVVILCDILLFCLDHNVPVDVPRALSSVRMQRMLSVQTLAQYKFVYHVLIRYLRKLAPYMSFSAVPLLAEATSNLDGPIPGYLYKEISSMTVENNGQYAEQVVDYLLGALMEGSSPTKVKCLRVLHYVLANGHPTVRSILARKDATIRSVANVSGGGSENQCLRLLAKDLLHAVHDDSAGSQQTSSQFPPSQQGR